MPFTFSHPAIILPLGKLKKPTLSLTALVIGSMTPDFEYFLRLKVKSIYSHTWTGLFWFDLPLGLLVYYFYTRILKELLIDNLPEFLNRRFSYFKNIPVSNRASLTIVLLSLLIGAASHIFWDSFTHPTGTFVKLIPFLRYRFVLLHFPFFVFNILQQISTIAGLLVIAVAVKQMKPGELTREHRFFSFWPWVCLTAVILLAVKFLTGMRHDDYGDEIIIIISGLLAGLVVSAIVFRLVRK